MKAWSDGDDRSLAPRIAMQMVHESALCVSGIRSRNTLCHQGFEVLNGLPHVVSDASIHEVLDAHTIAQAQTLQLQLGKLRHNSGHYSGNLLAFDPHRIPTCSRRVMPMKKKNPKQRAQKMLQSFFSIDAQSGQPLGFTLGSSAAITSRATLQLLSMMKEILPDKQLVLADTEHFTAEIANTFYGDEQFDILMPMPQTKAIKELMKTLTYERQWAGYALSESTYQINGANQPIRLIAQRSAERESDYEYKAFAATGNRDAREMLSADFPQRWSIEEFFNFEGEMGWNRAATMSLNVRYGKLSLALIAQAVVYQFRQKLPQPYKNRSAHHLAESVFRGISGDLKVKDDTIVVTLYNLPEKLNLKEQYENLPKRLEREGVDPRVPWLYDFKIDFRFK